MAPCKVVLPSTAVVGCIGNFDSSRSWVARKQLLAQARRIRIVSFAEKPKASRRDPPSSTNNTEGPLQPPEEGDVFVNKDLTLAVSSFSRRILIGVSASSAVALGGNLAGITSFLLSFNAGFSRSLRLDVVYPINGFKRCLEKNFEFLYPESWVGDQRLLYRAAERAEKERLYGEAAGTKSSISSLVEPVVAFGPPGSIGELNVSVIAAPIPPGFRLDKLGDPKEVGEVILKSFIGKRGVTPTLLHAEKNEDFVNGETLVYYKLDFVVEGQSFLRHNVSVYAAYNGQLFSMNVQTPEKLWTSMEKQVIEMATSFKVRP
ncbi:hypothetical protein KP509_30G075400 [Ceratopteris richardii]|uniref:PsbP C-terminal domain-containing protein n=1 Tax=Ceratopteris richardii TaxID=49495 RepID=A0A8T2R6A0_CERRI|nr:hypothetical protein KP509_30G075400 [Ceratopteris richardii]